MWRKTRQPYGARYGADPNRNFNYHFAGKFKKISIHYKVLAWPARKPVMESDKTKARSQQLIPQKGKHELTTKFRTDKQKIQKLNKQNAYTNK